MTRIHVITGAASGIGAATRALLEADGDRVIGVDLRNSDVSADLSTPEGRRSMVEDVRKLSNGRIDSIVACAGLGTESELTVRVNYFGAVETLRGLRPLLAGSASPRAVAISSVTVAYPADDDLLAALHDGDESKAVELAAKDIANDGGRVYSTTKLALAQWVRAHALDEEWVGEGIPLNAVAPGTTLTPLNDTFLETEEKAAQLLREFPAPLNGFAEPSVIAHLIRFLASAENTHITGQIVFIDGGNELAVRPNRTV